MMIWQQAAGSAAGNKLLIVSQPLGGQQYQLLLLGQVSHTQMHTKMHRRSSKDTGHSDDPASGLKSKNIGPESNRREKGRSVDSKYVLKVFLASKFLLYAALGVALSGS